jgi:hypothetical protein
MTTFDALEAQLSDLAAVVAFPRTPDLAAAVARRLRAPRVVPFRRTLRRSLLLAAALVLLVVGAALAVRFGLELLSIEFGPVPTLAPTPTVPSSPRPTFAPGTSLRLGQPVSLQEAVDSADFDVLVPEVLGPPDASYDGGIALRGQVAFVYAPRADLPAADLLDGAGLLITQNAGRADDGLARKIVDSSSATVQSVLVGGAPGVWISGAPHIFWYLTPDGEHINESGRLVGDTLAWERDGILYRIEGAISLDRALAIALSMR